MKAEDFLGEAAAPPPKLAEVQARPSGGAYGEDVDPSPGGLAPTTAPMGPVTAAIRTAGAAIPGGDIAGAATETLLGNHQPFRQNYDALQAQTAKAQTDQPVASVLGATGGGLATMAASGGLSGPMAGATRPGADALAKALAKNSGFGAIQGASTAAAEGKDAGEVASRALSGATVGAAVSTAVPLVSQALGSVLSKAMAKSDDKILATVGDGATKKIRDKINERADSVADMIRDTPSLAATFKTPKQFSEALQSEISTTGDKLDAIMSTAEQIGGKVHPQSAVSALKASQGQLNSQLPTQEIGSAMEPHVQKIATRAATMDELTPANKRYLTNALAALQAGKTMLPPEEADAAISRIQATLSGNGLSLKELRGEVTRLQGIAYDRSITAPPTPVRDAAGRAAGVLKDVLERHIDATLPGEADAVRKLNADQTVLLRLKAASDYRLSAQPNQQGTRLARIGSGVADAASTAAGAGTAALLGMGSHASTPSALLAGGAVAAAPRALRAVGSGLTEATAAAGRATPNIDSALAQAGRATNNLTRIANTGKPSAVPTAGEAPPPEPEGFGSKSKPIPFEEIHQAAQAGDKPSVLQSLYTSIFGR